VNGDERYFLSYMYTLSGIPGENHFGCYTCRGEHPVAVVERLNRQYDYRKTVLLWWAEIPDDLPEMDVDA
jgi:hypothetical protein